MNEYNGNNYDSNLNNEVLKTLVVFLGKFEAMNDRFEDISSRLKKIEEIQLQMIRKIAEGEVKVKAEKNYEFENDFRDVTSADAQIEAKSIKQEDKKDFIENLDNKNEDTWAKRLFKNEDRSKKIKLEVQGSAETKWSCAPVELFICNTDVEISEEDVKEAAKEIINVDLLEVERKTKEGANYGSFRIKVNRKDSDRCLKDESWPKGWRIRKFFRNYKVKKVDNGARLKKEIEQLQAARKEEQLKIQRDKLVKIAMEEEEKKQQELKMKEEVEQVTKDYSESDKEIIKMLEELKIEKKDHFDKEKNVYYKADEGKDKEDWQSKVLVMKRVLKEWKKILVSEDRSLKECTGVQAERKEKLRKCLKKMEVEWKFRWTQFIDENGPKVKWETLDGIKSISLSY